MKLIQRIVCGRPEPYRLDVHNWADRQLLHAGLQFPAGTGSSHGFLEYIHPHASLSGCKQHQMFLACPSPLCPCSKLPSSVEG